MKDWSLKVSCRFHKNDGEDMDEDDEDGGKKRKHAESSMKKRDIKVCLNQPHLPHPDHPCKAPGAPGWMLRSSLGFCHFLRRKGMRAGQFRNPVPAPP